MTLVTVLSLVSFSDPNIPKVKIPGLDKLVHFVFYGVATVLGCFFLRERTRGNKTIRFATIVFAVVTVFYGIVIELLQYHMAVARDGNVCDAIANISGSAIGVLVVFWLFSAKGPFQWKLQN